MAAKKTPAEAIPIGGVDFSIHRIRGKRVIFDFELAALYDVPVRVLNQAVTRNAARFPEDFMFRLTAAEQDALNRSQSDPKACTRAFTLEGIAMLSGILNSKRAVEVSLSIIRAL